MELGVHEAFQLSAQLCAKIDEQQKFRFDRSNLQEIVVELKILHEVDAGFDGTRRGKLLLAKVSVEEQSKEHVPAVVLVILANIRHTVCDDRFKLSIRRWQNYFYLHQKRFEFNSERCVEEESVRIGRQEFQSSRRVHEFLVNLQLELARDQLRRSLE